MPPSPSTTILLNRRRSPRSQMLAVCGLFLLFAAAVLLFAAFFYGFVHGEELAPEPFLRRKFQYHEIPLLHWRVTPVVRHPVPNNDLEDYLAGRKLVPPATAGGAVRWDLVTAHRGLATSDANLAYQGDARILCAYLDAADEKKQLVWLEWSRRFPERADLLWPAVIQVCRQDLYVFVPDLFRLAQDAADAVPFSAQLDQLLAEKFAARGQAVQALRHHAAAVELLTEAISRVPGRSEYFAMRGESYAALGDADRAAADRAAADRAAASAAARP